MKLPSLFPVTFLAGGILLASRLQNRLILSPRICLISAAALLVAGLIAFGKNRVIAAGVLAGCAWAALGVAAPQLEQISTPANLASALIESGKLDAGTALRWQGRLRSDPLELPWGIRYEIGLDQVQTGLGVTPVSGGLRLTYYRPEPPASDPAPVHAGDRVEVLARAVTVRNFGDPGSFDYRGYLGRQDIQLQATLRNAALLTALGHPQLTVSEHFARLRGRFLRTIDELFASRPEEGALARAMLLGDRSFVEHDRVLDYQKTGVYHALVLAGLHVGALAAFFLWLGERCGLACSRALP